MTPHPNASIALELWRATSESNADGIRRLLSRDVEWVTEASGELSGTVVGREAVIDMFARAGEMVDELRGELIDCFASENGAILDYRLRARRGTHLLDVEMLLVLRVRRGEVHHARAVPARNADEKFWRSH